MTDRSTEQRTGGEPLSSGSNLENQPWSHDTPDDLSPNNYARAMSYMHVARFTDVCLDRCRIVVPGELHGKLTHGDRACIDSCFQEVKHNYSMIYTEYKEAVRGFFTE